MTLEQSTSYITTLIDTLYHEHTLTTAQLFYLLTHWQDAPMNELANKAKLTSQKYFGTSIYTRGLIEISNYCKNDCYYCGIRKSNLHTVRYRLTETEILTCCQKGYDLGCRTFVLQSGEDAYFTDDRMCQIISSIKSHFPDCAITLSIGEKPLYSYMAYKIAGANRFLLRHEAAHNTLYGKLHPPFQTLSSRKSCLDALRELGYQVGVGFMVDAPYQTATYLLEDFRFVQQFKPEMIGIGPFIPHHNTPFANFPAGNVNHTLFLLSLLRLMFPNVLLPATTALATLSPDGYEKGIAFGSNVIMFNLTPPEAQAKYTLYDHKNPHDRAIDTYFDHTKKRLQSLGYNFIIDRGDFLPI